LPPDDAEFPVFDDKPDRAQLDEPRRRLGHTILSLEKAVAASIFLKITST
jgi:hypothetical protein